MPVDTLEAEVKSLEKRRDALLKQNENLETALIIKQKESDGIIDKKYQELEIARTKHEKDIAAKNKDADVRLNEVARKEADIKYANAVIKEADDRQKELASATDILNKEKQVLVEKKQEFNQKVAEYKRSIDAILNDLHSCRVSF